MPLPSLRRFIKQAMRDHGIDDVLEVTLFDDDLRVRQRAFVPRVEANREAGFFEHADVAR